MVRTIAIAIAQSFKNRIFFKTNSSKSLSFECYQILKGQSSDPLCVKLQIVFRNKNAISIFSRFWLCRAVEAYLKGRATIEADQVLTGLGFKQDED